MVAKDFFPPEILIEQCRAAGPLIRAKMHRGFHEGDYIWDGKKVRLIGHDSLNITQKSDPKYPVFTFAMLKPQPVIPIDAKYYPHELEIMHGNYIFEVIRHPVWIPTPDQLQRILLGSEVDYITLLRKFIHFTEYHNSHKRRDKSKEQLWLEYFMWKRFKLLWNYLEHTWEFYLGTLSEED